MLQELYSDAHSYNRITVTYTIVNGDIFVDVSVGNSTKKTGVGSEEEELVYKL
jgi:hypothetical protein